jgi:hypothetical protein
MFYSSYFSRRVISFANNSVLVNEAWKVWEKTVSATCKEGEKMDRDRVNILREKLWIYANIFSDSSVAQDECCESLRKALEACDFEKDIQEFLQLNDTGNQMKEPPAYVPFTIETAEEYDAMAQKSGIRNKGSAFLNFLGMGNSSASSCNFLFL